MLDRYRNQIKDALKNVTNPKRVHEAREATRAWLENGRIELAPNRKRGTVEGTAQLYGLGDYLLGAAGLGRKVRLSGSGGTI